MPRRRNITAWASSCARIESTNRTLVRTDNARAPPPLRAGKRGRLDRIDQRSYVISRTRMMTLGSARTSIPPIRAIRMPPRVGPAWRTLRPFVVLPADLDPLRAGVDVEAGPTDE